MSAGFVNLQAQVESLLGGLVKAASVELVKLFESRYQASTLDVGLDQDKQNETIKLHESLWFEDTKRSIGIQVEEDFCSPLELSESSFLSDCGCLGDPSAVLVEGGLIPAEAILTEEDVHADPEWLCLDDQIVAETLSMVELSVLETKPTPDTEILSEVVIDEIPNSMHSSPSKEKVFVMPPDTSGVTFGGMVKFVCPLILKPDSPVREPDSSVTSEQVEPQQTCVSTAKGKAYSPSSSDGAVTPSEVGMWEHIHSPKETKNHLPTKEKLSSFTDQKLHGPSRVQLVDILRLPESEMKTQDVVAKVSDSFLKSGWPVPKDFRRHHGPHTGHRLCCFTQCEAGIWRLDKVVTNSCKGFKCNICGKKFKHRKFLRRHERFHTGEKPYQCSLCSKTFALRKSLRRHMRFHTGERPHTCTQCGKSFRLRDNLKAHLRFHTGEKPFRCSLCGKEFRILRNLETHKLSVCDYFVPSFRMIAGIKNKRTSK